MVYDLVPGSEEGAVAQQQGCSAVQRHDSLHPSLPASYNVSGLSDTVSNVWSAVLRLLLSHHACAPEVAGLYVPAGAKLQLRQICKCPDCALAQDAFNLRSRLTGPGLRP